MTERNVQIGFQVKDDTQAGLASVQRSVGEGTREIEQQGRKAADGLSQIGKAADASARQADGATRSLVSQIQRLTAEAAAGQRGTAEYFRSLAQIRGVDAAALEPYIAKLEQVRAAQTATAGSMNSLGVSAAQTAAALRTLPAQFTDIATSLASGQAPLTVLLQQGGQIKDAFGGVGEAVRAVGGYLAGLVNPVTIAAAAVGALAFAWVKGREEQDAYIRALAQSGNAIGLTTGQLADAARSVAALGETQGKAAQAVAGLASSTRIASADLEKFASAAILIERAFGTPIEKTRDALEDLGRAPSQALLKLNEGFNFLTAAVLEQVTALEQVGRTTEAARLAQETWANAQRAAAQQVIDSAGLIEGAWNGIKSAAKGAWDAMLDIGRDASPAQRIAELQSALANAQRNAATSGGLIGQMFQGRADRLSAEIAGAQALLAFDTEIARQRQVAADQQRAAVQWQADGLKYATKQAQMEREIAQAITLGVSAGLDGQKIGERVEQIRAKYAETARAARSGQDELNRTMEVYNGLVAKSSGLTADFSGKWFALNSLYASGKISLGELLSAQATLLEQQPVIKAGIDAEAAALREREKALAEAEKRTNAQYNSAAALLISIDRETATLRMSNEEREISNALFALEKQGVDASSAAYAAYAESIRSAIRQRETVRSNLKLETDAARERQRAAESAQREWQKSADNIERALTDALMRGFEGGKGFAKNLKDTVVNMFKTMVLRPVVQAIVSPVAQGITGMLGLSGAANAASTASTAFNAISTAGSAATFLSTAGWAGSTGMTAAGNLAALGELGINVAGMETAVGAGSTLGPLAAAAPYIAAAALLAFSLMGEGGGPKTGGSGVITSAGETLTDVRLFTPAQRDAEAVLLGESVVSGINKAVESFGGTIGDFTVGIGFDLDQQGTAPNRISSFLSTAVGDAMRNVDLDLGRDAGALQQGLGLEVQRLILAGLQSAELPQQIAGIFASVDAASATQEQIAGATAAAASMRTLLDITGHLSVPLDAVTAAMWQAAGGVEALTAGFGSYVQNFYSDAERFDLGMAQLGESFAAIGIDTVPQTREAFRALVEGLNLTTESGQAQYGALISLSGAYAALVPATQQAAEAVDEAAGTIETAASEVLVRLRDEAASLERELALLKGADARTLDTANMTAAEVAAYDYNATLRDQIKTLQDAAQASSDAAQAERSRLDAVASEAASLDQQLFKLTASSSDIRAAERAQIDAANLATYDRIIALQDEQAATEARAAVDRRIAEQRTSLESEIFRLTATSAEIRAAERAQIDASNLELFDRIAMLRDEQSAAESAARAAESAARAAEQLAAHQQRIADQRYGLETQLLQLQGDTSALRARELAQLDPSNRALQERIWAMQDEQQAAQEAARAAEDVRKAWASISDSIVGEVERIRGEIIGKSASSYAALQAQFASASAAARAGDRTAAESLAGLARLTVEAGAAQAESALEAQRIRASIADSLDRTAEVINPAVDMSSAFDAGAERISARIESLREDQRVQSAAMADLMLRLARITERWDGEGLPQARVEA